MDLGLEKQIIKYQKDGDRKIPFEITAAEDPFYSESNLRHLLKSKEQIRQGKVVVKTMKELEIMANE